MKRGTWRKRLIIWLFAAILVLPIACYGLSNLFLISPKGREYVSSRISGRIQLETSVKGTTWSPWNGITVYGLRIEQPTELQGAISPPLLTIQSIRLDPVWNQLLRKRLDLKGIDLVKPDIAFPIELLSLIPSTPPAGDPLIVKPPDLARNTVSPELNTPNPQNSSVIPSPTEPHPPQPKSIETEKPTRISTPTRFIGLTGARVRIVTSMSDRPLYEIQEINARIPYAGKNSQTDLITGRISTLGNEIAREMKIPLNWSAPALTASPIDGKVLGLNTTAGIHLRLTQGLPLRIVASIPEQKDKEILVGQSTGLKLGAVGAQGIFQGLLSYPSSWQGQAMLRSVAINGKYLDNETHFDSGHALFIFRNGALSCADARLNGEKTSILSNATLLSDGRAAANLRIVASHEILRTFAKFTDPTGSPPYFTPLHTPQRAALDLEVFGRLGDFRYKPNPQAKAISFR